MRGVGQLPAFLCFMGHPPAPFVVDDRQANGEPYPLPIIGDEMNVPAENGERPVTVPVLVGGIDRSPLLWPLVVAALLMPALVMATAGFLGLL